MNEMGADHPGESLWANSPRGGARKDAAGGRWQQALADGRLM